MNQVEKISQFMVRAKNVSPLRIGNGDKEGIGLLLYDDHPVVNGTTLAGLFNNYLKNISKQKKDSYYINEVINSVFPQQNDKKEDNIISTIYFYDSISENNIPEEKDILQCRSHVRIDSETSTACEKGLFKEFHISKNCCFTFFFEVKGVMEEELYNNTCDYLYNFIEELTKGQIFIGSNANQGFGQFNKVSGEQICYKEYKLECKDGMREYLNFSMDNLGEFVGGQYEFKEIHQSKELNSSIEIKLKLYCEYGFIIKGKIKELRKKSSEVSRKINTTYEENDEIVIPSSTLKGVTRSYCEKIISSLELKKTIISDMFGENQEGERKGKRGSIVFKDIIYPEGTKKLNNMLYNRIRIDRFTGGAMDMSLRGENLTIINKVNPVDFVVIINKNDENINEILALLLLTFRDIALGEVTIGSGEGVGYGRFTGIKLSINNYLEQSINIEFKKDEQTYETQISSNSMNEVDKIINVLKSSKKEVG